MLQAVLLDVDGTLGETIPICVEAFQEAIAALSGRELGMAEIVARFGPSEEGVIREELPDRYPEGMDRFVESFRRLLVEKCPRPFPGVTELLSSLRQAGVKLAVVTGKGPRSCAIALEQFGLSSFFPVVETGSPRGPEKELGIARALERLGVAGAGAAYVGDAPSDIKAARLAGVRALAAAWSRHADPAALEKAGPDSLFTSVAAGEKYFQVDLGLA
ncbi:MAG: HAD family hydrolase [Planctomycetota bacterium]|jgi:phosphoglycolate phosphatase/pyrophosphatase PpaX|nr:HAD family hydrolase [Planctomycetota bacterium]